MCGGALVLLEDSLSRGCCLQCSVLLALGGVLPNLKLELSHKEPKQQTDPGPYAWVVFMAGDTLRHQPMGVGHMTMLQSSWAYRILCPTMVSPNANWNIKEDKL